MNIQELTKGALEASYKNQVGNLFKVFIENIVASGNDENRLKEASEKFKSGLQIIKYALEKSEEISGIS